MRIALIVRRNWLSDCRVRDSNSADLVLKIWYSSFGTQVLPPHCLRLTRSATRKSRGDFRSAPPLETSFHLTIIFLLGLDLFLGTKWPVMSLVRFDRAHRDRPGGNNGSLAF